MTPCVVWVTGATADLVSTEVALNRGAVELNPIQQTPIGRIIAQATYATTGCLVDSSLKKRGKTRLAKGLRIGFFVLKMGIVFHNVSQK
jgi:hypothetical protein